MTRFDEGQIAGCEKQDRSNDVRRPDDEVFLEPGLRRNHRVEGIEVEKDGARELQRTTQPAGIVRLPTEKLGPGGRILTRERKRRRIDGLEQLQVGRHGEGNGTGKKDRVDRLRFQRKPGSERR